MEAGTNVFSDPHTFSSDAVPSSTNSTKSTDHLVTQLETAGIHWMSYQQGITSGTCPIATNIPYAPKHDPFVFFQDVSGKTPSAGAARCAAHHKDFSEFAGDLASGNLTGYVFITGDLCHDMHGDPSCPAGQNDIHAGDDWLKSFVPSLITYAQTHDAVIFITWDEGDSTNLIPFLALGHGIKPGSVGTKYDHGSMLKSVEEYLGVPVLATVTNVNDFHDLFAPGMFP
jgi:phospholipase C